MKRKKLAEGETTVGFGLKASPNELGTSGTDIVGGMFGEETLFELKGQRAAIAYDRMRRREAQVSMLLDAMLNPIVSGNWQFEVEDEADEMQLKMKELCEWNFRHGLVDGLKQHLREALTYVIFGYSVFEVVHATENVPALENQLVTFFKKLAFRKQSSIYRWHLEKKTGRLLSVEQQTVSDVSDNTLVNIPGEHLLVFTNKKEGDNYEGISALRPMFGAYSRKDLYLKLTAIGAEKNAIGTVVGTTPANKTATKEDADFEAVLAAWAENEVSYIKIPQGWSVDIKAGTFDPQKMVALLNFENEEMARAVVAGFLMLGAGGGGGSYSLGTDLSDFFLGGIQSYADAVCEVHNRKSLPALCQLNYGPQAKYPTLKCTGINDKAGEELAKVVTMLIGAKGITPDSKLEDFLRAQYKLPKQDEATARQPEQKDAFGNPIPKDPGADPAEDPEDPEDPEDEPPTPPKKPTPEELGEKRIKFGEGYKKNFDSGKAEAKAKMQAHLRLMADDLTAKLRRNWNAATDAQKINAGKDVAVSSKLVSDYKKDLRESLAKVSTVAIAQARKEAPAAAKDVKFGDYDKLNPLVKRAIETQLGLVTKTQVDDLTKMVLFQFSSSSSQSDIDAIVNDIESRVKPMLEGSTNAGMSLEAAAGDLTAHVVQNSRNSFFFAPEVLATIESFTFTNEDPVSEICQNLNGQTFLSTDPNAEQFYPPLHHNCKSRIVPNAPGEAQVTGISIVADSVEERARLEKQITLCDHNH